MQILRKKYHRTGFWKSLERGIETGIKTVILLAYAAAPAVVICIVWYFYLFQQGIHFHEGLKEIAITAWIPTFGILYALLAAVVLNTVWNEYKSMRMAVKNYDIVTFMNLRDEEMSPLVHALMAILSFAVLGGFMGLPYPDAVSGLICIGSTSLLFGLIFFVIMEIDNPLEGLWFIKNVHVDWLEKDVKEWRAEHWAKMKATQK